MNNFRSGRDRGRSSGRNPGDRGGRREMFDAVCSNCGKDCKIPFQPRNDKPVYCSDCFEKMGNSDSRGSRRRDFRGSTQGGFDNKEFQKLTKEVGLVNAKLEKIISILSLSKKGKKVAADTTKKQKVSKEKSVKEKKPSKKKKKEAKK